jgi:uncharacterized protein
MGMESTDIRMRAQPRGMDWPIVAFFALAYALAWGVFLAMRLVAQRAGMDDTTEFLRCVEALDFKAVPGELALPPWLLYALSRVADFAFSIAGVTLIAFTAGKAGLRELVRSLIRWRMPFFVALAAFLPMFLYFGAALLAAASNPEVRDSFDLSSGALAAAFFGAETGIIFHLLFRGAMGEELGLRGFALPRLQARFGPVRASLIIGVFWYLWHLPILVGRGTSQVLLFGVLVLLLTFIFTWLYNGSGGSLLPGLVFHAIQNSEEAFERLLPAMKGTSWEGPASVGLLLFGIAATVRVIQTRRRAKSEVEPKSTSVVTLE